MKPERSGGAGSLMSPLDQSRAAIVVRGGATNGKGKKAGGDDGGDDDDEPPKTTQGADGSKPKQKAPWSSILRCAQTTSSIVFSDLPSLGALCWRSAAAATVALYVLNQKHLLPLPAGKVVSKLLFWPTLPVTVSRRIGKWTTVVDDAVVLGGAPFGFAGYPNRLSKRFNVRWVVNMCDKYRGPVSSYARLGVEHLRLPVEDLKRAVSFVQRQEARGGCTCTVGPGTGRSPSSIQRS
ncbi:hypothetical protein ACHAWF_005987 [Thalassiosira exigua]